MTAKIEKRQWIVLLDIGETRFAYGPTDDEDTARDFAEFLSTEVDPAEPVVLYSPTRALLAHWKQHREQP